MTCAYFNGIGAKPATQKANGSVNSSARAEVPAQEDTGGQATSATQPTVIALDPPWLSSTPQVIPGQVYVGVWTDTAVTDMRAYAQTLNWPDTIATLTPDNVWVGGTWPFSEGGFRTAAVLPLRADVDVMDVVTDLESLNWVLWAEPERILAVEQFIPDDPLYDPLPPNAPMYHHTTMDNPDAWLTTLGDAGIEIAVIDQGVDIGHDDLAANIDLASSWDFVDNDNDPSPSVGEHHGTYVAGIAAAVTNNAAGVAGGSTIMPLRVYTPAQRNDAIQHAVDDGADIINTSLAVTQEDVDSVAYNLALNYAYPQGVLHINSAGNDDALNPARQKLGQTLYVAATDWNDQKASFSNYGAGIDISAPGRSRADGQSSDPVIWSTLNDNAYGYYYIGGTSFAAPNAAGAAALIWSANPTWTRDQVAAKLIGTADNIDALNPGYEGLLGSGRVNSNTAVNGTLPPPRIEGLTRLGRTKLFVELGNVFEEASVENAANWELREDGADGIFGNGDDVIIPLARVTDYMIGTNSLEFTYSAIPDGTYRFTGFSGTPFSGKLSDPFNYTLDGNGDGTGGDDYVFEFEVVALDVSTTPDGSPDTFLVTRNGDQVEVKVNGALAGSVSVNGQAGGQDVALLDDSPGVDVFKGWPTVATFEMQDAYKITANNVRYVDAFATEGQEDEARFYGDAVATNLFKAWPNRAELSYRYNTDFLNRGWSFRYADAWGVSSQTDVAKLYDSDGDDTFVGDDQSAWLSGNGFDNKAWSFAIGQAIAEEHEDNDTQTISGAVWTAYGDWEN